MKLFSNMSKTARAMALAVAGVCLLFLVLGLAVIFLAYPFEEPLPFTLGLAAGCLLSMLKVVLLEKAIDRSLDMGKEQAMAYTSLQAIARYGLTGVLVAAVILFPNVVGLFGVIPGLLSLQLAAYIVNIIFKRVNPRSD